MRNDEIIVEFGQYSGITAEALFSIDPKYCQWIVREKGFKRNFPELVDFLNKKFEKNPSVLDAETLDFGPYYGKKVKDIISDKNYCGWLINKSKSFKFEYPNMYQELVKLYNLHYSEKCIYLYVLRFKNADFIKVGKTKSFIVRRMYDYIYGDINYMNENVDWSKSFVYKTNCLTAENDLIKLLSKYKVNGWKERFSLEALDYIQSEIHSLNVDEKYYFNKKILSDFIPFKDSEAWRNQFYVPINAFKDFERMYIDLLDNLGLIKRFNPEFIVNQN